MLDVDDASTTATTPPSASALVFVLTVPLPRADISIVPGLVSTTLLPTITDALSLTVLMLESATTPLPSAPPVTKLTLSAATISFNARTVNSPALDSSPVIVSRALSLMLTFVSKSIVVRLFALAPLARPPVVPRMLSAPPDRTGLRYTLPASIAMDCALMTAPVPTSNSTVVTTSFLRLAPAPASNPPANVRMEPFSVETLSALPVRPAVRLTVAEFPIDAVTLPLCRVVAAADAPAAMPPLPAWVSENMSWSRVAPITRLPPVRLTSPRLAVTTVVDVAVEPATPAANKPPAKLSAVARWLALLAAEMLVCPLTFKTVPSVTLLLIAPAWLITTIVESTPINPPVDPLPVTEPERPEDGLLLMACDDRESAVMLPPTVLVTVGVMLIVARDAPTAKAPAAMPLAVAEALGMVAAFRLMS